ncbi:SIR2 family protein [Leuconostoc mesenteroides]|uniref:SIR2 family protein n=1 Tax=Leuconostoc mesenteroides TaxID=1245 RepID=UPI002360F341|nr:SIR2 family protein [Leuconostoc mesenteroides]
MADIQKKMNIGSKAKILDEVYQIFYDANKKRNSEHPSKIAGPIEIEQFDLQTIKNVNQQSFLYLPEFFSDNANYSDSYLISSVEEATIIDYVSPEGDMKVKILLTISLTEHLIDHVLKNKPDFVILTGSLVSNEEKLETVLSILKQEVSDINFMLVYETLQPNLYHYNGGNNLLNDVEDFDQQKIQVSQFFNTQIKCPNLNILIGSGASVPDIPLMNKTMKEIVKNPKNKDIKKQLLSYLNLSDEETRIFSKYFENKKFSDDEWKIVEKYDYFSNIEGFMSYLQQKIATAEFKSHRITAVKVFEKLKSLFIETIPKFNDDKYLGKVSVNYQNFYQSIFSQRQEESPKLNIFTTNYDLFNEVALEKNEIKYTSGFKQGLVSKFDINQFNFRQVDERNRYKDRWQPTTKEANLYKLHGSINWIEKDKNIVQSNADDTNIIIYPTILKHIETAQIPYSPLFRDLSIQLQKPNSTLIIIGYGFGDDHINNLILQNLSHQDFNLIIFGNIEERNILEIKNQYASLSVHIIGGKIDWKTEAHFFEYIVNELLRNSNQQQDRFFMTGGFND